MIPWNPVRKAIESTYTDTCFVYEYRSEKDPVTKIMKNKEVLVLENIPCRISFHLSYPTEINADQATAHATQRTKLFLSERLEVKEGSKIVVTRKGKVMIYQSSGIPDIHETHQEIMLKAFKGWV